MPNYQDTMGSQDMTDIDLNLNPSRGSVVLKVTIALTVITLIFSVVVMFGDANNPSGSTSFAAIAVMCGIAASVGLVLSVNKTFGSKQEEEVL
jgi:uncharacterized membrane protein